MIKKSGKCRCSLRRRSQELSYFITVDTKIGKSFVGEPARKPIHATNRFILPQGTWVEIKPLDNLHQNARRQGALVSFD
jgi:hypothetical protein